MHQRIAGFDITFSQQQQKCSPSQRLYKWQFKQFFITASSYSSHNLPSNSGTVSSFLWDWQKYAL